MAQRGPYRKGPFPIFSGIELPPKPDRGAKPHDDSKYLELAAGRKAEGKYRTSNQAAYHLAGEFSERDNVDHNALYCRLRRKLKPLF